MAPYPLRNDIFISYCHKDDQPFGDGGKRWVADFHRDLRTRTEHYLGRAVSAWRDGKLSGADVFSDEIATQIGSAAVLVSILSPSYLASEWCLREVQTFTADADGVGGLRLGNALRLVKVMKTPVPRKDLQRVLPLLDTVLGYEFYRIDRDTEVVRELFLHPDPDVRREYWTRIDDVAQSIAHLVLGLGDVAHPEPHARVTTAAADADVLYLAETTSDLHAERDRLRREFEDRGYRVVPERPLPTEMEDFVTTVRADLERARLSVHLFGGRYGFVPEGSTESSVALQSELASTMRGADFSRILWIPPGTEARDDRQVHFLEGLRQHPGRKNGYELIEAPLEQVKALIIDRLHREAHPAPSALAGPEVPLRIYVCCDRRDLAAVEPLADHLQSRGYEVILPMSEGDPAQLDQDHQDTLRVCDAVVLFWGAADEFWFRTKQRDLVRARGLGRDRPFRAIGVYATAPETPAKRLLRSNEAVIVRRFEAFAADAIEPLVAALRQTP
jgi:TIR domain-containing protein